MNRFYYKRHPGPAWEPIMYSMGRQRTTNLNVWERGVCGGGGAHLGKVLGCPDWGRRVEGRPGRYCTTPRTPNSRNPHGFD